MKKVLIIGGTGNISSKITDILIKKGYELTLLNRGNQTVDGAKNIVCDRTDYAKFEEIISKLGYYDCVIDMVGYNPDDIKSSIKAFAGKTEQYIFCSTVDVYTKPAKQYPIKESAEREVNKRFSYAYNKAICERLLEEAQSQNKFNFTIIRPAATYNDTSFPISFLGSGSNLLKRIEDGEPIIILGDGTSLWVSTHRDDVAKAFVGAINNLNSYGKYYNVSGDEAISWITYYEEIANAMKAPPLKTVSIPADFLVELIPETEWCFLNFRYCNIFDNTQAKLDLGFEYTITWHEGITRFIEYHKKNNNIKYDENNEIYNNLLLEYGKMKEKLIKKIRE